MKTEKVKLSQVALNRANPRRITDENHGKLVKSILVLPKMLEIRPVVVDSTMTVLGGNMRLLALQTIADLSAEEIAETLGTSQSYIRKTEGEREALLGYWADWKAQPTVTVIKASELSDEEQRQFIIKDNVGLGDWDMEALMADWDMDELLDWGMDESAFRGADSQWRDNGEGQPPDGQDEAADGSGWASLTECFVVPPFSVLDSRKGYWQARKRAWRGYIGELGGTREDILMGGLEMKYRDLYRSSRVQREELGISFREFLDRYVPKEVLEKEGDKVVAAGVSLFDPVLSEISCRWFTPYAGARIFDNFAGDTQKGLVFAKCGYRFTGIELRREQVELNNGIVQQRGLGDSLQYICDDGINVLKHIETESQDMLFSCPPYYDLEKYSELPNDASNQGSYANFIKILEVAYSNAVQCLKNDRFAVIVVGDIRDRSTGCYYDFCGDIKRIFRDSGMALYNELILVEAGTTVGLRAGRYMVTRKVGKMHQNVLVFYKGDTARIKETFSDLRVTEEELALMSERVAESNAVEEVSEEQVRL